VTTTYLATVLPGLEDVAASEIQAKFPGSTIQELPRGKVIFTVVTAADAGPSGPVLAGVGVRTPASRAGDESLHRRGHELRTAPAGAFIHRLGAVDNVYALLARLPAGPQRRHLADLAAAVAQVDVETPARQLLAPPLPRAPTFVVNGSRAGRQTYSRVEAAAAAERGVVARHPRWRVGEPRRHDLELRLDVEGERALFSLRLSAPAYRYRSADRAFSVAALRPSVAHALVWLSGPSPDDVFVDPFCGSGTIVAERTAYPARRLLAGDLAAEAVAATRQNVPAGCLVAQWDARRLPLAAGSTSILVANLPFGRQVLGLDEVDEAYHRFAAEARRVLARGGAAILLTEQDQALLAAAEAAGLRAERLRTLSLKGLRPHLLRLMQG
jgi:23S rRNA G2445 N2-methylase RlmL